MSQTDSYYSNLLILEYHDKPKAKATIEASVGLLPDDLIQEVSNGFNLDTAVGKQLDVLGQYIGTDRYFSDEGDLTALSDDDYRMILKLKIISNNGDMSHKTLDEALYKFFGETVRMDSSGNMEMEYFVPASLEPIIKAAIQKEVLPRPMGVNAGYIKEDDRIFFAFCTYSDQTAVYRTGFRDYNDPTKVGEVLTYDKRI